MSYVAIRAMLTALEADGLRPLRDVVDLQRHVVQVVALVQQALQAPARIVAVGRR
jgi:hypothetical protein